jgi:hypothetical protein
VGSSQSEPNSQRFTQSGCWPSKIAIADNAVHFGPEMTKKLSRAADFLPRRRSNGKGRGNPAALSFIDFHGSVYNGECYRECYNGECYNRECYRECYNGECYNRECYNHYPLPKSNLNNIEHTNNVCCVVVLLSSFVCLCFSFYPSSKDLEILGLGLLLESRRTTRSGGKKELVLIADATAVVLVCVCNKIKFC